MARLLDLSGTNIPRFPRCATCGFEETGLISPSACLCEYKNADETDHASWRTLAQAYFHEDGECEIDDQAEVSISKDEDDRVCGAYVQAWVCVGAEEEDDDEEEEEVEDAEV